MKFPITYSFKSMTLRFTFGKYYKFLQCPFKTWWKARKYFRRPRFKFYFGPTVKNHGKKQSQWGEYIDYTQVGFWPMASTEYLKWHTPKWFPIHIMSQDIGWKDKWHTPRYENPGYFAIFFGRNFHTCWQFSMVVKAPEVYCDNDCTRIDQEENYWESILWYLNYADCYNKLNKKQNLFKARQSMKRNHWSTTNTIDIKDFKIKNIGTENLELGNNHINDGHFVFVDITSERVGDYIADECSSYRIYKRLLSDCNMRMILTVENEKSEHDKIEYYDTEYVSVTTDDELNETIRLFFNKRDYENLYDVLKNEQYKKIGFQAEVYIDLGPTFKDEFLKEEGVELIRKWSKK